MQNFSIARFADRTTRLNPGASAFGPGRNLRRCAKTHLLLFSFTAILLLGLFAAAAPAQVLRGRAVAPNACRLFEPPGENAALPLNPADLASSLLAVYNSQAHRILSLKTVAEVRVIRGPKFGPSAGKSRPVGSFMDFEQPGWLRVTGVVPLAGTRLFDMSSDGREFRLLAPDHDKMTLFVGPSESQPDFTAGNLSMRPQEFLDALRWEEGKLRLKSDPRESATGRSVVVELDLPLRLGKAVSGRLLFDVESGTVSSLQILNADGVVLSELQYAEWRPAKGDSPQAEVGCLPFRVRVLHPVEDYQIDIRFLEITLNPQLPRSGFRFHAPRGVPVVRVDDPVNRE